MHVRPFVDTHNNQRRIELNRAEGICGHAMIGAVFRRGNDSDTGREAAKDLAK
jgi:hypothetical protein